MGILLSLMCGVTRKRRKQCADVCVIVAIRTFRMLARLPQVRLQVVDVKKETKNTMLMGAGCIGFGKQ